MAYSTINKSSEHFKTKIYTGNNTGGASQNITGVGFQPDLTWIKDTYASNGHHIYDSVRGATKRIRPDSTSMETTASNGLTAFTSDGFNVGDMTGVNNDTRKMASWNWKAGGTASTNTDGTITASVSANQTAGFSIIEFTGTEATGSVGHGLNKTPTCFIMKRFTDDGYSSTSEFYMYFKSLGADKYQKLQATQIASTNDGSLWSTSTPADSSVINIGGNANSNHSGTKTVIYAFAEIEGYSKFGKYYGGDKTFVYTGFKPRFILGKENSSSSNYNWHLFVPELPGRIESSSSVPEYTDYLRVVDWNSNGFRWANSLNNWDRDDRDYVYLAFGQTMVGTNDRPCTAGSTDG